MKNSIFLSVILLLCIPSMGASQARDSGALSEASFATMGSVAFGSVTASYTTFLTNPGFLRRVAVVNLTDMGILCSFNASTDHVIVPSQAALEMSFSEMGLKESSNVSCKREGSAPTSGTVYVWGFR